MAPAEALPCGGAALAAAAAAGAPLPSPFSAFALTPAGCGLAPAGCGLAPPPAPACGGDAAAPPDAAPASPARSGASSGSLLMDCDPQGAAAGASADQEAPPARGADAADADAAAALDALLAAAARKPGYEPAAPGADHAKAAAAAAAAPLPTPPLPPAALAVAGLYGAARVPAGCPAGIAAAAADLIARWGIADTFYVYDLGEVARLFAAWRAALPRVAPFYAVKCNPEPGLLAMLDALGAGFDCASVRELQAVAALGVPQDRIVFANPCKVGCVAGKEGRARFEMSACNGSCVACRCRLGQPPQYPPALTQLPCPLSPPPRPPPKHSAPPTSATRAPTASPTPRLTAPRSSRRSPPATPASNAS
jgi:hypothetical protein